MEKNTQWLVVSFAVLALLVGTLIGAILVPTEKEVIKEVEVIKTVSVEVPVEVEVTKEVEVEKDFNLYKDNAVTLCFDEFLDDADLDRYQDAEINKVSDKWSIVFDVKKDKDRTTTTVNELRIRVYDTLLDTRTTSSFICEVVEYDDKVKVKLK